MTTKISNLENEPFLLPIDISKYNGTKFEPDEIEIRVTNDFIEIAGQQQWRMCSGGADRISFQIRHVIPKYIDLNAVLCRLMDDSVTILITAPSLSMVSKLSLNQSNQPIVDYVLGLDRKGLQYLKRYNTKNSSLKQIEKTFNKEKLTIASSKDQADAWLFDLVNNASKTKTPGSKLFSSKQGQKNVDFVNNLISNNGPSLRNALNNATNTQKIHLDVQQLFKSTKLADGKKKKSRSKKKKSLSISNENKKDESVHCSQEDKKKDQTAVEKSESSKINKIKSHDELADDEQQRKKQNDEIKVNEKKNKSTDILLAKNEIEQAGLMKDLLSSVFKNDDSPVIKKDVKVVNANSSILKKDLLDSLSFENKIDVSNYGAKKSSVISPTSEQAKPAKNTLKSLFTNFLNNTTSLGSGSSENSLTDASVTSVSDRSKDEKNEMKKEKHVVIVE